VLYPDRHKLAHRAPLPNPARRVDKKRSFHSPIIRPLLQSRVCKSSCVKCVVVDTLAKRFFVSGGVQGVGFRYFVERTAASLGVNGYVRNLFDGRVEVYAIGNVEQIATFRNALRRGPRMASVQNVEEIDADFLREYANGFSIENDQ
jgi:acylphosphatase